MENEPNITPVTTASPEPAVVPVNPSLVANSGVKSYLAMITLAFFALPTGLARAYRGEKIGWTRFWLYIGASLGSLIPFINLIAGLLYLVLIVWGIVDFFLVYRLRDDTEGKPLHATPRDQKWASTLRILYIIGLALSVVIFVLALILSVTFYTNFNKILNDNKTETSLFNSQDNSDTDAASSNSKATEVLANYSILENGISRAEAESILGVTSDDCSEYSFGDSKSETCTYGSYDDGYMITLSFGDDKLNSKSKYE